MPSLLEKAGLLWLLFALVAGVLELIMPAFAFSFIALGALSAAIASLYWGWELQAVTFVCVTLLSLLILRPLIFAFLRKRAPVNKTGFHSRSSALIGLQGEVTIDIRSETREGRILVKGEDWAATSEVFIPKGRSVEVVSVDSIYLHVREI